jgi:hypothetical protein
MSKSLSRKEHTKSNIWKILHRSVGKAVTVSKGSNSFKAFYLYTFNINGSSQAVVATIVSATADSSNELPLSTEITSMPAGNRKHTEKEISLAKQPHRHQRRHLQ